MKYILEIKPEYEANGIMILGARDSHLYVTTLEVKDLEELNSDYINEHYGDLQDTAYQHGLEDAWEAAKKISLMPPDEIEKVFPGAAKYNRYNLGYSGVEAIAKLKAYEEKRKADSEIKVGDEVYAYTPSGKTQPFVIIKIYDEDGVKYYSGINADGNHVQGGLNYIKTGRHFPHVAELLKEMQS